jgi:transcriptional regulator with XRE-family HTH domain
MTDLMERPLSAEEKSQAEVLRSWHNVARGVARWRAVHGWTQQELAWRAGTKQSRISEIEGARGNVRFDTLNRVTQALNLEVVLQERSPEPLWLFGEFQPFLACAQVQFSYETQPDLFNDWYRDSPASISFAGDYSYYSMTFQCELCGQQLVELSQQELKDWQVVGEKTARNISDTVARVHGSASLSGLVIESK